MKNYTKKSANKKLKCKLCGIQTNSVFQKKILNKYMAHYNWCSHCQFLFTEPAYWLKEAYKSPINQEDTGLVSRNLGLSKISTSVICLLFNYKGKYLDYSGGYGLFTRLMRDIGLDYYWDDPYTKNIFSVGFQKSSRINKFELVTAFEVAEHFENPLSEFKKIQKYSNNILFTTELIPKKNLVETENWDYLGPQHGQHVSFYTEKALRVIGKHLKLNYFTDHHTIHLFTKRKMPNFIFKNTTRFGKILYPLTSRSLSSYKFSDHEKLSKRL